MGHFNGSRSFTYFLHIFPTNSVKYRCRVGLPSFFPKRNVTFLKFKPSPSRSFPEQLSSILNKLSSRLFVTIVINFLGGVITAHHQAAACPKRRSSSQLSGTGGKSLNHHPHLYLSLLKPKRHHAHNSWAQEPRAKGNGQQSCYVWKCAETLPAMTTTNAPTTVDRLG